VKKTIGLPLGTEAVYDAEDRQFTLTSLCGMSCGHNGLEDDYSCSGSAVICVDDRRLEGAKLECELAAVTETELEFSLSDAEKTVRMENVWHFEPEFGLISCRSVLVNTSDRQVVIRRALPRWVFAPGDYTVLHQMNRWGAENQEQRHLLRGADLVLHARAARSTVGTTPFCVLRDNETGKAAAFHVLPKGNWVIQVHSDILSNEFPSPVVEAGLADTDLFWSLNPGERIELPEVLIQEVPSDGQSGALLQRYMIRKRLPKEFHLPPVIYNSWLYRFSNFTHEELSRQLAAAKAAGCEAFVVDAGWFGPAVGDWREKEGRPFFGNMAAFADEVRAAGLKFGFWMEPQRWVPEAPIRAEHPEWFPEHSIRIDLLQKPAAEYFYRVLADNIRKFGAEYIKIDFNASVGYDDSGTELSRYCAVLHEQLARLRREFPDLVIENCASGALNCDLVTAQLYDLAFVSDNAHPYETLRIRQGVFRRFLPGRVLNWIVMRPAPERFTAVSDARQVLACAAATWDEAALFDLKYALLSGLLGVPGFSGDLAAFPPETLKTIAEFVCFYRENRAFFVDSHVFSLTPPSSGVADYENYLAFQMQGNDVSDSLLFVFTNSASRRALRRFRLLDLAPEGIYRVTSLFEEEQEDFTGTGEELMRYGVETRIPENQHVRHAAKLYRITRQG